MFFSSDGVRPEQGMIAKHWGDNIVVVGRNRQHLSTATQQMRWQGQRGTV